MKVISLSLFIIFSLSFRASSYAASETASQINVGVTVMSGDSEAVVENILNPDAASADTGAELLSGEETVTQDYTVTVDTETIYDSQTYDSFSEEYSAQILTESQVLTDKCGGTEGSTTNEVTITW